MRTNFHFPLLATLATTIVLAAFLAGCDKKPSVDAQARSAGEQIDRAAETAKEQLAEAAKKTEVAVNEGADKLKPELQKAGAEIKPQLESAGQKLKEAAKRTGDQIKAAEASDSGITGTIKTKYVAEPGLSALKIDVDTHDGVVTLNGVVKDEEAKQRAEKGAAALKGVKSVRNHLTIKQG